MGQKIKQTEIKEVIRSVVKDNIKEVTTNDWHFKAIMSIWDKGGSFTRKKLGTLICRDTNAKRSDIEDALRDTDYSEITDFTDRLRIEGVIKEEDSIPGGLAKGMTLNDIAEKHGVSVDILVAEFKKGIQTEMEHTTDKEMAKEIALDHLFEDPQYYTKLATVEEYVDDKGVEHVGAALPQTEEEPIKEEDNEESSPEQTLAGLKEMAMGNLERIGDYAKMITERMQGGQELESWMYSQLTIALENLNSVHDAMDGSDGVKESVNEEKVYIDYLNKQKGFKQDRIKFNSYEEAVKWARKNFEKFNPDMIKYESVNEAIITEDTKRVTILGIDFNISEMNGRIFFSFVDKKAASIKIREIGTNKIVNLIQKSLDNAYGKGEFFFKSGDHAEFQNGYLFQRNATNIKLNKLKFESVNEAAEPEVIAQIKAIAKNHQHDVVVDPKSGKKMKVDAFSASAIATVYDALSDSNKEKFVASGLLGMQSTAMKILKR